MKVEDKTIYEVGAYHGGEVAVINFEDYVMTTAGVKKQVAVVHEILDAVMKKDEHYGTIPGTNKPSLYKPGAEKLSLVFRLRPEYEIRRSDLGNGHREYEVVCTLYHIPTSQSVGQGVGSATTMEGKYRYRTGPVEFTGKQVPKEYWNERDSKLLGGKGFIPKKNDDGQWEIAIRGEQIEHDNPADYYNTILKMAKKRAHVDAILTATAASDIFTQDVEDMPEVIPGAEKKKEPAKEPIKPPQKKSEAKPPEVSQSVTVKINDVQSKEGEANGKPYTIYTIFDENDEKYGTFDKALVDIAADAIPEGVLVKIGYTEGKFGKKITTLELAG
jgi:hypothetical protein